MDFIEQNAQMRFFIALALGFLMGLERETTPGRKSGRIFAGVRTYSLVSLFGFGCAWLFQYESRYALPAGLITLGALCLAEYFAKLKEGRIGWTSEIAVLLSFVIGASALLGSIWMPITLGVISTILLSEKSKIERYVDRLTKSEFLAITRFLLVTVIIYPMMPNRDYTQFGLNPTHIWKIVMMVSSIGFVGYFLGKKFGAQAGLRFSGFLGGIVSSTAVSVSVGRHAQKTPMQSLCALQASLIACSVMYLRILILVWIINVSFLSMLWWRMLLLSLIGAALSFYKFPQDGTAEKGEVTALENPFEIIPALMFAFLFVALSVVTAITRDFFGSAGLLVLAAIVGVTDIDPFLLSLVHGNAAADPVLLSAFLIAMMSNTIMKGIYFGTLAVPVRKEVLWRYGIWALLHIPLAFTF